MTSSVSIPDLPLGYLKVTAQIDYVKVHREVYYPEGAPRDHRVKWHHDEAGDYWLVTIHDPTAAELRDVVRDLLDPHLYGLEIAVDFWPLDTLTVQERQAVLFQTYTALAARFRPDDELLYGAGYKAAHSSLGAKPFHNRIAVPGESLVYGHRIEGQNAKLYLKTQDMGKTLPEPERRVRLETTLERRGCYDADLLTLRSVLEGKLRRHFAKVFRVIDRPEVRKPAKHSPATLRKMEIAMASAWECSGVGGFDPGDLPADAMPPAVKAANYRRGKLLSTKHYKLRRHAVANAAIGEALRNLDRRLKTTFPGGSTP